MIIKRRVMVIFGLHKSFPPLSWAAGDSRASPTAYYGDPILSPNFLVVCHGEGEHTIKEEREHTRRTSIYFQGIVEPDKKHSLVTLLLYCYSAELTL